MRFLQVLRGYVCVPSFKTSKIAYANFIIKYVIQLIVMSTLEKPTAPGGFMWLYFCKNNFSCVLPMFECADIFILDAVYNDLKQIFSCFFLGPRANRHAFLLPIFICPLNLRIVS